MPAKKKKENLIDQTRTLQPGLSKEKLENIGPYKILEVIGKGGMGTVYLAQQEKPIRRKVALKVIKPGMDSKEIVARFESEQQALAMMNHPNIAQVYDSGTTEQGYPYFVMEYVPGLSVTEYCDKYKMTTEERLTLFENVCGAIQHAHFRGIVHRDLKPSNVLVSFQDEKHIPKIIDFGIAKALTGHGLTEKTIHTKHGLAIGTPVYMSPEQAELSGYDIDTRTDVYSLGVMLYELLVGVTPFDKNELEKAGLGEILRIIREDEPPRPSTRFNALGDTSTEVAKKRGTSELTITKQLKGDLDWIVMKAIEKDQRRRYISAAELATDIERYLNKEPVQARPPSVFYKVVKYVRRNKARSLSFFLLILLIIISSFLYNIFSYRTIKEKKKTELAIKDTYYNYALALKEKAKAYAKENQWQLVKLFSVNSLLYQVKAQKYFSMGDIDLPVGYEDWILKHTIHSRNVVTWSFSPDGRHVASVTWSKNSREDISGGDNKIKIWDVSSGTLIAAFEAPSSRTKLCFSPDGRQLASGGWDGAIKIWEIPSCKEHVTLSGIKRTINSLSYSPDGKLIASGGYYGEIKVWEISSGKEITALKGHTLNVESVSFSPDGRHLASASLDTTVKLWEISSGKEIATLRGHTKPVDSVIFSPEGRHLVSGSRDETIKVWDVSSGQEILTLSGHKWGVKSISFSPDGKYITSAGVAGLVKIWEISSGKEIAVLKGPTKLVYSVSFSSDGKKLFSGSSRKLNIWEISGGAAIATLKGHSERVTSVDFSPDGRHLASGSFDRTIKIWDISSGKAIKTLKGHNYGLSALSYSPDGKYLASVEITGDAIIIWDVFTGRAVATLRGFKFNAHSINFSPDGKYLAPVSSDREIKIWEVSSGREIATLKGHLDTIDSVSFSPDGKLLASGSYDGTLKLWEIPSGKYITTLISHTHIVNSISFSPNGKYLASGGTDKKISIWEISTGKKITTLKGHIDTVASVIFSPDGKRLISGSYDRTLKLWDVLNGKEITTLNIHSIGPATFSPDWKYLAVGVELWDISKGKVIATLKGHKSGVESVSFSPDGKLLASGSFDKTIKIWDLDYLWLGFDYPYKVEEVEYLLKDVEEQTGFILDGLSPASAGTYSSIGSEYLNKGKYDDAIEVYKKTLKIEPNNPEVLNVLGWMYFLKGDFNNSEDFYKKAREIDPDYYEIWHCDNLNSLGWDSYLRGDYQLGLTHFNKAVEFNSQDFYAQYNIALTYLALREFENSYNYYLYVTEKLKVDKYMIEGAIADIAELTLENPDLTFSALIVGYLLNKLGESQRAKAILYKFINQFKGEEKWKKIAKELLEKK